eukprot:3941396-Lingulodinium_polyedra.AAC.1
MRLSLSTPACETKLPRDQPGVQPRGLNIGAGITRANGTPAELAFGTVGVNTSILQRRRGVL